MENNNAPLLEMRSIKKDFFGNQVLTDISFTLREGEVLGLVGENGAGKSTLMKILFGMDVIRETGGYGGDVLINGEKVTFNTPFDALEAGIGMVTRNSIWGSDSNTFAWKGIPAMTLNRDGFGMHTRHDTISLISPWSLERSAILLGTIAEHLGNIAVMPFVRTIPEQFMRELDQYFNR